MNQAVIDSAPTIKNPELQSLVPGFDEAQERSSALLRTLSPEQLHWQPSDKSWSVAQCLDHLDVCAGLFVPAIQTAIARSQNRKGDGPIRHGWLGGLFLRLLNPKSSKKIKAPGLFAPSDKPDLATLEPRLVEAQREFIDCLHRADGLDLRRIKLASPAIRLLRLPLGTWLIGMKEHQLRHLDQADRIQSHPDFPKS